MKNAQTVAREVEQQLEPVFSEICQDPSRVLILEPCLKDWLKGSERAAFLMKTLYELRDLATEKRKAGTLDAIAYLVLVETMANQLADRIILLLIATGHDFHVEPDSAHRFTRHAKSIDDIRSPTVTLSVKIDFLEENGLRFFSKWIDRKLRNKIAHMEFDIDENGVFSLFENNKKKEIKLEEKLLNFCDYLEAVTSSMRELVKRLRHTRKRKQ